MIRFLGLVIVTERTWMKELAGATDLGLDIGRVHGRCEIAEH